MDGDRRLTFAALAEACTRLASRLATADIGPDRPVGLWAPNSADWIIACVAVQLLGAAVVPINSRLKGREAAEILDRTRCDTLLTVARFAGNDYPAMIAAEAPAHLRDVHLIDELVAAALRAEPLAGDPPRRDRPDGIADIIFTSGTTGAPKGVMATHFQNVATADRWATATGLREGDRYLLVNPFFHCFGYKAGWLACLLRGATAVSVASFAADALPELIAREDITVLAGAPTIMQALLDAPAAVDRASTIRVAVTGAASVPPALIERLRSELHIPTVLTGYGLTEATGVVTMTDAGDSAEVAATTAGRAVSGVEVVIVDGDGRAVPAGTEGEVRVRGDNVMAGYFEDHAATIAAIDDHGWLRTGDIGRLTETGCLQITDRMKDMYISGGFNCYPAEIERLMADHPAVAQVAVIGIPDARLGEIGHAYVTLRPGAKAEGAAIAVWARAAMANYKAPRCVEIVTSLPTNPSGKVQKFLLPRPLADG